MTQNDTECLRISVGLGKIEEPERSPNAERVRRGAVGADDRPPKARGVSMQPGGPGGARPPAPQRVRAEPGRQTAFGAFLV